MKLSNSDIKRCSKICQVDKARVYLPFFVEKISYIYGVLQKPSSEIHNDNVATKMKEKKIERKEKRKRVLKRKREKN